MRCSWIRSDGAALGSPARSAGPPERRHLILAGRLPAFSRTTWMHCFGRPAARQKRRLNSEAPFAGRV